MIRNFGGVTGLTNQPQGLDIGIGVAIPWINDWSAYQTVYDLTGTTASVPASTWQTFVNISGKGFLKWCRISDTGGISPSPHIRITVDGVVYQFDGIVGNGDVRQGNEVNIEIPFNTSLKIEAFNTNSTTAASIICDYLYLLQQSTPDPTKNKILLETQRKMAYGLGTTTALTDVLNITGAGYLLGIHFYGHYSAAGSTINGDIVVDGVQKMTDRILYHNGSYQSKQSEVVGPIRFTTSLRIRARNATAGGAYTCLVFYSLD